MTAVTSDTLIDHYIKTKDVTSLITGARMMEHKTTELREKRQPDWRELALYSALAALLPVLNASITVLLVF